MRILNSRISEEFLELLQDFSKIYRHKNQNLGEDRFFPENGNSISEFPIRVKLYNLCFLVKLYYLVHWQHQTLLDMMVHKGQYPGHQHLYFHRNLPMLWPT